MNKFCKITLITISCCFALWIINQAISDTLKSNALDEMCKNFLCSQESSYKAGNYEEEARKCYKSQDFVKGDMYILESMALRSESELYLKKSNEHKERLEKLKKYGFLSIVCN